MTRAWRAKVWRAAGDAIVKTGAEGDEQIALGHAHVGGVAAVHAGHADEVGVAGGEAAEGHEGADGRGVGQFRRIR